MDYEKAYNEAIEKIRNGLQPLSDGAKISGVTRAFLEEVFPELKESEDERIRKALVRFHKSTIDVDGIKGEEIVAWLEKQVEQKSTWSEDDERKYYQKEVDYEQMEEIRG